MSTHYIEEAQRLAQDVAIMSQGRIIAQGEPHRLIAAHAGREVVEVFGPPAELEAVRARLTAAGHPTRRAGPALAILRAEQSNGEMPKGERRAASLEDVYVLLTGESMD